MNLIRTLLLLPALLLSGCVDTDHLLLTQSPPERITAKIPVVILDAPPTRPFVKLAMVQSMETGRGSTTWEELRKALIEKAEELNADALMDLSIGSETSGGMVGMPSMGIVGAVGSIKQLRAIAIRYTSHP